MLRVLLALLPEQSPLPQPGTASILTQELNKHVSGSSTGGGGERERRGKEQRTTGLRMWLDGKAHAGTQGPKFHPQPCKWKEQKQEDKKKQPTYKWLTIVLIHKDPTSSCATTLRKISKADKWLNKEVGTEGRRGTPLRCSWFKKWKCKG